MPVSITKALELIYENVNKKTMKLLPLEMSLGKVLAQDVTATHNLPPFDNSAMDGYAVCESDADTACEVIDTIFAGDDNKADVGQHKICKIMTGARIPKGCELIVPVEDTTQEGDLVKLPDALNKGQHIRLQGEDIKEGDLLIKKGQRLSAHHITLLASQGISHIRVYKQPRVALFASGHELKMHFEQVADYQLYNTNTPTILSRCKELGCFVQFIGTAEDSLESIHEHINSALDSDLIITSGGVSVGDADYTKEAFNAFEYENIFEKVDIKPGKPTIFGKVGNTYVLNLPGNPLAAALIFELFGQSIINALSGDSAKYLGVIETKMANEYHSKPGRFTLVPGYFNGQNFTVCEKYAPGMISPLAHSNAFALMQDTVTQLDVGHRVKIIPTRFSFHQENLQDLVTKP